MSDGGNLSLNAARVLVISRSVVIDIYLRLCSRAAGQDSRARQQDAGRGCGQRHSESTVLQNRADSCFAVWVIVTRKGGIGTVLHLSVRQGRARGRR